MRPMSKDDDRVDRESGTIGIRNRFRVVDNEAITNTWMRHSTPEDEKNQGHRASIDSEWERYKIQCYEEDMEPHYRERKHDFWVS